ncbi:MAG: hypothetical protein QNJ72_08355 [Pleurocapsa sp. MO_226.B13]|nr:hypothetical protein [Pleurocapsa sp. MO_226.B13]
MIQGRIPEITIKFSDKPDLPTEGKKVTLEIQGENNVTIKAEVNRKTLKKQVAKMDEYDDWVGALSGKIKSVSADGLIELEAAGVNVFEKKKKEPKPDNDKQSTAA